MARTYRLVSKYWAGTVGPCKLLIERNTSELITYPSSLHSFPSNAVTLLPMKSLAKTLLNLRLKWYRQNMFVFLERYSHMLIITFLCVLPIASEIETALEIAQVIALPVTTVAGESAHYSHDLMSIAILHVIFVTWLSLQGKAVTGEPLTTYLASLPITVRDHRVVNIQVVVLANHLTWLMFILPLFFAQYSTLSAAGLSLFFLRTTIVLVTTIGIQMTWLYGRRWHLILFALTDLFLVTTKFIPTEPISILGNVMLLLVSIFCLITLPGPTVSSSPWSRRLHISFSRKLSRTGRIPMLMSPMVKIYLRVLFSERVVSTSIRLTFSGLVAMAGTALIVRNVPDHETGRLLSATIILLGFLTFLCSGLYKPIYDARQSFELFLRTLPIKKYTWVLVDTATMSVVTLSLSGITIVYLLIEKHLAPYHGALLALLQLPLLFLLYPIRSQMNKQASAAAISVSIVWTLVMLAFFS